MISASATLRSLALIALAGLVASCQHAPSRAAGSAPAGEAAATAVPPQPDPAALEAEARALLRSEGELLWARWTTGTGALPASAQAGHEHLWSPGALQAVAAAAAQAKDPSRASALEALHAQLLAWAVDHRVAPQSQALAQAVAQLAYAVPGEPKGEHPERELAQLLENEASPARREAIFEAETKAIAAAGLPERVAARDAALEAAAKELGFPSWPSLLSAQLGQSPERLAALAEATLAATDAIGRKATAEAAVLGGISPERLRQADLPRLSRSSAADAEFPPRRAWDALRATLALLKLPAAPAGLRVDAEPSPSKGGRPLAVLVDPPADVRFSLRAAGGFEEARAILREGARAELAAQAEPTSWERAQLGTGTGLEAASRLFESLAGHPHWLREQTQLRGGPLDDVVHASIARRLLELRRAAALVLFEVKRRADPAPTAQAALYRSLLERATFAAMPAALADRWAVETDPWLRAASVLQGGILAAQLELAWESPGPQVAPPSPAAPTAAAEPPPSAAWVHQPASAEGLLTVARQGRSGAAEAISSQLGLGPLDPTVLAKVSQARLAYRAPEAPPATQRPDYKYMQGDKKRRHKRRHRRR